MFTTPRGRYRSRKLPFGILTATDDFQKATDKLFGDMEGVIPYIDDLIVWGSNESEHNNRLERVLRCCQDVGLLLNPAKCHFNRSSVRYLGHILTSEGFNIDSDRVTIIREVDAPRSKKELQSFLGMVNFVRQFIENFSERTRPLRELVRDMVVFDWLQQHRKCFEELKECLVSASVLRFSGQKSRT